MTRHVQVTEQHDDFKTIGMIGVGIMGQVIVQQLLQSGYTVVACDVSPQAREYARQIGAEVVEQPGEVAHSAKLILLSLPGPKQIEEVVAGENGILRHPNTVQVLMDLSTVGPETTKRMVEQTGKYHIQYLDAPILGRPSAIGKWVMPVGGDAETLERCRPVLETFAEKAIHVGPSGSGNTLKLLNQLMFSTINAVTAEVLAISAKAGLSSEVVFNTIASSGASTVSGLFREVGRKIVERDFDPVFTIELLCKDSNLGLEMARGVGAPSVIAQTAQIINDIARGRELGNEDTSALVKAYENIYG